MGLGSVTGLALCRPHLHALQCLWRLRVVGGRGGRRNLPLSPESLVLAPWLDSRLRVLVYFSLVTEMENRNSHLFAPPCCDTLIDQPGAINL